MILELDPASAGQLAMALALWRRQAAKDGIRTTAELHELELYARNRATSRQEPTNFDPDAVLRDLRVVEPQLLDVKSVAATLAVSSRGVERLIADGRLPAVRVGGATRVRIAELRTYIDGLEPARRSA